MKFGESLSQVSNPSGNHMVKIVRVVAPVGKSCQYHGYFTAHATISLILPRKSQKIRLTVAAMLKTGNGPITLCRLSLARRTRTTTGVRRKLPRLNVDISKTPA